MNRRLLCAAAGLFGGLAILFLNPAPGFFFGDSIALLWGRPLSLGSLLLDFARLDASFWYRPLSNSLPPFLLWPLFGTSFLPYHLVALALHGFLSLGVFVAFRRMLRDEVAAFAGAAFFAFHPIQFYATYDIAFYQEPMMAAGVLGAIALLHRYAIEGAGRWLALGLLCFLLALWSKETAIVLPALLALVLWRAPRGRSAGAIAAVSAVAAVFALCYVNVLGVVFRYHAQYRPRWQVQAWDNSLTAVRWAFGIPAGAQTAGWQFPLVIQLLLLATLLGVLVLLPRGTWRGLAWFCIAALPAFFTNHLLPHHLYLALIGVAYGVATMLTILPRSMVPATACASLGALFVAALLSARADAVVSWVGRSAWQARAVADFVPAAGLRLREARGVIVAVGSAPHLTFDWMAGRIFPLLGHGDLEFRLVGDRPAGPTPEGFYLLEYRDAWLWRLEAAALVKRPETSLPLHRTAPVTGAAGNAVLPRFRVSPARVHAGSGSYCLDVPQLAGETIDLKYRYNQRLPQVAWRFTQLDRTGRACIAVPASVPWGTVDIVAVRPSGSILWLSGSARLEVRP